MRRVVPLVLLLAFWSLSSEPSDAADKETIRKAIDRGAKFLKSDNVINGLANQRVGYVAVIGLALLESDIPPSDPALVKITERIRSECLTKNETYDVSLALMYLDRLGDAEDVPIIQYLGVRLLAGQTSSAIWSYASGPAPNANEATELQRRLIGGTHLKKVDPKDKGDSKTPKKIVPVTIDPKTKAPIEEEKPAVPKLHPEVARILDGIGKGQPQGGNPMIDIGGGDHSNTQFAIIALWCSRKHGVPADAALGRTEQYFRNIQNQDGGWSYNRGDTSSTAAMTCPGLISLAMGYGVKKIPKGKEKEFDPNTDPWMKRGLIRLGSFLNNPVMGENGLGNDRGPVNLNFYFIWSLERTGMIYGIDTMNNVDWFDWGCGILLKSQAENGSWSGGTYHGASADLDTAFAILFLNRANLAKDLTANLKGRVRDPGATTLKGGKDLESLIELGKNPPKNNDVKTPVDTKPTSRPDLNLNTLDPYEKQVRELADSLINATSLNRKQVLEKLRDTKGGAYTDALGRATRRLEGEPLKEAREAFAARLTRMTATTLRELMKDDNREVRRAAILACAMKEDKSHIPDLIEKLNDRDPVVNRAARASLKSLTGKDFGPEADASAADVAKAVAAWKEWYEKQK